MTPASRLVFGLEDSNVVSVASSIIKLFLVTFCCLRVKVVIACLNRFHIFSIFAPEKRSRLTSWKKTTYQGRGSFYQLQLQPMLSKQEERNQHKNIRKQ
jgi:hypothetical protein